MFAANDKRAAIYLVLLFLDFVHSSYPRITSDYDMIYLEIRKDNSYVYYQNRMHISDQIWDWPSIIFIQRRHIFVWR